MHDIAPSRLIAFIVTPCPPVYLVVCDVSVQHRTGLISGGRACFDTQDHQSTSLLGCRCLFSKGIDALSDVCASKFSRLVMAGLSRGSVLRSARPGRCRRAIQRIAGGREADVALVPPFDRQNLMGNPMVGEDTYNGACTLTSSHRLRALGIVRMIGQW